MQCGSCDDKLSLWQNKSSPIKIFGISACFWCFFFCISGLGMFLMQSVFFVCIWTYHHLVTGRSYDGHSTINNFNPYLKLALPSRTAQLWPNSRSVSTTLPLGSNLSSVGLLLKLPHKPLVRPTYLPTNHLLYSLFLVEKCIQFRVRSRSLAGCWFRPTGPKSASSKARDNIFRLPSGCTIASKMKLK